MGSDAQQTSQRIIDKAFLEAAGSEENWLILQGRQFFQKSLNGELILFSNSCNKATTHCRHKRFYKQTEDGHYTCNIGSILRSQEQVEEEEPEPEAKAIKLYYHQGK